MIQITDNLSEVTINLPKIRDVLDENPHILTLKSKITNKLYEFDVEDEGSRDFYVIKMDFSTIPNGEYEYTIDNDAKGLLRVGDLAIQSTAYNADKDGVIYYTNE